MDSYFLLNEKNYLLYAMHKYQNPCMNNFDEFVADLRRISLVFRLIKRFKRNGVVNARLLINHIISLHNVFDVNTVCKLLFFRIPKEYWPEIKTCLVFLRYLPDKIYGVEESYINTTKIPLNSELVQLLRQI